MDWHTLSVDDVLKKFNVSKSSGLNSIEVSRNRDKFGRNILTTKKKNGIIKKFLSQFSDCMIIILLIAALISFITSIIENKNDYIDPIIILFIVIMNAIIGVVQENKAEKAIEALKKLTSPKANVLRNNKEVTIPSEDLVPGDIITLHTGDLIPADCRILEDFKLESEESSLTGESLPVVKKASAVLPASIAVSDRKNMLFSGCTINSGHCTCIVVETGMNTEVGKIASMLKNEDSPQTPLQKKLEKTSKILGFGVTFICFIIFILGIIQDIPFLEMFMISISLAVAAIPEGLPAVVTIVLAMGIRRMAKNKAIIRKLPAVETLGNTTVICSDKTGTLTQNKMTVTKLVYVDNQVSFSSKEGNKILELCTMCNNANLSGSTDKISGEATEKALIEAFLKIGKSKEKLDKDFPRVSEFPFKSSRKLMTTVHKLNNGKYRIVTKGAPDFLLKLTNRTSTKPFTPLMRKAIMSKNDSMTKEALRVLAVGYKDVSSIPKSQSEAESNLIFCGLVGMIDPARPEAKVAVRDCKKAGIKPVMITGDHINTAKAIAKDIGIFEKNDLAITGVDIDKMPKNDFEKNIFKYSVFARVSPEHKVRIVKAFQKKGAVVAMTGDGVNDAPALKAADIGCAMGKTGTDVAKGAADMIMTDDNFSTIVKAIKQGRGISQNIKKTVHFLLSSNIGEIITVLTAFLLRLPTPLLAIQLLWVNLVTDSFPALALGVDPVDDNVMLKKPAIKSGNLFSSRKWKNIVLEGSFIGAISILAFTIGRVFFDTTSAPVIARTMAFTVLSLSQIVHSFNVRSDESIFKTGILGNMALVYSFILCAILQVSVISVPFLSVIFKTVNLNFLQWVIVLALSASPLLLVETEKITNLK